MRIVIDLQGAQTANRFRGIGRYTLSLARSMIQSRGEHEVILALNGLFNDTIEPIRAEFDGLLPSKNICVWAPLGPVGGHDPANDARRKAAEAVREAFVAELKPDVILVASLFEGWGCDAATSVTMFNTAIPTAVVLYDLIPLIYRGTYLSHSSMMARWYFNKLGHLQRADLLLSISASSSLEATRYLDFPKNQVINISAACDAHFRPQSIGDEQREYLRQRYGITRPFVFYTAGIDPRKNIEGLIRAYALLPPAVRDTHSLVLSGKGLETYDPFIQLAQKPGLKKHEIILTGYVSDDDLILLYNTCTLFVFPSWHEGFGLPVLEAMACGKAVIAANSSSLPEVIANEKALFPPRNDAAMAAKMAEVLCNPVFRAELEQHGLAQSGKFSWASTARRAWRALEALDARHQTLTGSLTSRRPRLAFVSPLPPEQTGIADYSAELLPQLARHYEIEVIVAQDQVVDPWVQANLPIRDVAWFRRHADRFDRVLYHFGNSSFHAHMFDLLREIPGVVVLHDFFLSGVVAHRDVHGMRPHSWAHALVFAHGWPAVRARFKAQDTAAVVLAYPCNLEVLQQALGVIVHSEFSRQLARQWYGENAATDWACIPHLRTPAHNVDRVAARLALGLKNEEFIVCSFGLVAPAKLNHRLVDAWLASPLAQESHCRLVFVGQSCGGDYGQQLLQRIQGGLAKKNITITNRVDAETYKTWLAAADVGVQLRALSRGETSGAVLDCMNYGLATVINAHGSLADLPKEAVWLLADEFSDVELADALTTLWLDPAQRQALGARAHAHILRRHDPCRCAEQYFAAIERYDRQARQGLPGLLAALPQQEPSLAHGDIQSLAISLSANFTPHPRRRQLLLDISTLIQEDARTGIQRVTRSLLSEITLNPPAGWAVEPVYATTAAPGYRYARRFMSHFLDISPDWAKDERVETWAGDVFLGLDLNAPVAIAQHALLQDWRRQGVAVHFVVYDLLPVLLPHVFSKGADQIHQRWLETITSFDGALCISQAVADELREWLKAFGAPRERPFALRWFHLGADIASSIPTNGLPPEAEAMLAAIQARPTYLMVGTIEPRKRHLQTICAFEQLWANGIDINLVIVGKQGWMVDEAINKIRRHRELDKRLFWLESISDEYLEQVYAASTCLIAASEGEGFGLPLIEAAQHRLPILARDIRAFREVADEHATYFPNSSDPAVLAEHVRGWLDAYRQGGVPLSDKMPYLTWAESAQQLLASLVVGS